MAAAHGCSSPSCFLAVPPLGRVQRALASRSLALSSPVLVRPSPGQPPRGFSYTSEEFFCCKIVVRGLRKPFPWGTRPEGSEGILGGHRPGTRLSGSQSQF